MVQYDQLSALRCKNYETHFQYLLLLNPKKHITFVQRN